VRPAQIPKRATQAVVGGLMGGSGPKSVSGSSRMNSELDENDKDTVVLDWFRPSESKTLRPVWPSESKTLRLVWWDYVEG
jgi:hypothetical protein